MSTIIDPPTPVNDAVEPAADRAGTPDLSDLPRIDIHEAMLSPFADADHARWMIGQLYARGWHATYQTRRPRWSFGSYEEAARFREDFDAILLHAAPTFVWPIEIYDADEGAVVRDWAATVAAVDVDTPRDVMGGGLQ